MPALTKEEFIVKAVYTGDYVPLETVQEWALEAGALLGALSLRPDVDHDTMVAAIQTVALRMPENLVSDSVSKLKDVVDEFGLL